MKLYLVQHGEALAGEVDPDRPLSDGGRRDVERLAEMLERCGIRAVHVLHSGKTRARQTASRLARALTPGKDCVPRQGLGPNDSTAAFAEEAGGWTDDVVIVGHMPFVARLASRLVAGWEDAGIVAFRPGAMVCLERDGGGDWSVAWMLKPGLLGGGGPP